MNKINSKIAVARDDLGRATRKRDIEGQVTIIRHFGISITFRCYGRADVTEKRTRNCKFHLILWHFIIKLKFTQLFRHNFAETIYDNIEYRLH